MIVREVSAAPFTLLMIVIMTNPTFNTRLLAGRHPPTGLSSLNKAFSDFVFQDDSFRVGIIWHSCH